MNGIQLKDVDFNLLKVLDTLAREMSIARTARRLGVTPSAISHALGRLRRTLKDPLVVRSGRSLRLTPRALALAPVAASICESARGVLISRAATRPADWQETLRFIGSDYALTTWVFPAMIAARTEAPRLRFAASTLDAAEWERQLIDGVTDLAVRNERPANAKLRWSPLATETYVTILRRDHPLARGRLTLNKYCRAEHGLVSVSGGAFRGPVDEHLESIGKSRNVVTSVPTFLSGIELVRRSDLLMSMPLRLALGYEHVVDRRPFPFDPPTFDATLIWHARTEESPPHKWFRRLIAEKNIAATSASSAKSKP